MISQTNTPAQLKLKPPENRQPASWLSRLIMESCESMCFNMEEDQLEKIQSQTAAHLLPSIKEVDPSPSVDFENETLSRSYGIVIFAASSSVGQFLVEEMALVVDKYYSSRGVEQQQPRSTSGFGLKEGLRDPMQFAQTNPGREQVPRHSNNIKWAVAGRSASKLSDALCRAELSTGVKNLAINVPVLLADLNQQKSLLDMCSRTKVIVNCAGPYSSSGQVLIKACLQTKTDYIDLSHESTHNEKMRQLYSSEAKQVGVYIINGCGFQSMSAEIGLNFVKQVVEGQISEIKIILELNDSKATTSEKGLIKWRGVISRGMWRSLLAEKSQTISMDEKIKLNYRHITHSSKEIVSDEDQLSDSSKPLIVKTSVSKDVGKYKDMNILALFKLLREFVAFGKGYCLPINSLIGKNEMEIQTQLTTFEQTEPDLADESRRPVRSASFISLKYLSNTIILLIWLVVFNFLARFSPLRLLMKTFPYLSSLGHVNNKPLSNRESLSHIKFCQTFLVYGAPLSDSGEPVENQVQKRLLVARVVGPEPNHVATATFAAQAALALVLERDHLPLKGGVITPGSAFAETNMIYKLRRRNIKFEVLKRA